MSRDDTLITGDLTLTLAGGHHGELSLVSDLQNVEEDIDIFDLVVFDAL